MTPILALASAPLPATPPVTETAADDGIPDGVFDLLVVVPETPPVLQRLEPSPLVVTAGTMSLPVPHQGLAGERAEGALVSGHPRPDRAQAASAGLVITAETVPTDAASIDPGMPMKDAASTSLDSPIARAGALPPSPVFGKAVAASTLTSQPLPGVQSRTGGGDHTPSATPDLAPIAPVAKISSPTAEHVSSDETPSPGKALLLADPNAGKAETEKIPAPRSDLGWQMPAQAVMQVSGAAVPSNPAAPLILQPVPLSLFPAAVVSALSSGDGIAIDLSPVELGRVRVEFSGTGPGVDIRLIVERQETLPLVKSTIDNLTAELRQAGIQAQSVSVELLQTDAVELMRGDSMRGDQPILASTATGGGTGLGGQTAGNGGQPQDPWGMAQDQQRKAGDDQAGQGYDAVGVAVSLDTARDRSGAVWALAGQDRLDIRI